MVLDFQVLSDFVHLFDNGLEIFCSHGHVYTPLLHDGKKPAGCETASKSPNLQNPSVFFYGHTHVSILEKNQAGITVCNPGSISLPKGGTEPGFAVMETKNHENLNHKISLFNMEGQVIKTLEF